jgi:hypothetical protein
MVKKGDTPPASPKLRVGRTDPAGQLSGTSAKLAAGQQLIVPTNRHTPWRRRPTGRCPPATVVSSRMWWSRQARSTGSSERIKIVYQVKKRRHASSIARLFQTSVASVQTWNAISGMQIRVGER